MFLVLERLIKVHASLRQMVVSNRWTEWGPSREARSRRFEAAVLSFAFWDDARAIVTSMQPIYSVLHLTDREGCTLGLLYEFMDRMGEQLQSCTGLDADRYILLVQTL